MKLVTLLVVASLATSCITKMWCMYVCIAACPERTGIARAERPGIGVRPWHNPPDAPEET